MIYFDSAATTLHKPPEVKQAVCDAMDSFGNAGRGVNEASLEASRSIYSARALVADFFQADAPQRVAFTMNVTEALNMAIRGLIVPGDHIIATAADHNSVLRPCYDMERAGAQLTIVPCDERGRLDYAAFAEAFRPNTRAVVMTHASNVTGNVYDIGTVAGLAKQNGCAFILDAAQTAGVLDLRARDTGVDILCFTGHKSLMGPQGTGGLCVRDGVDLQPILSGGTGVQSYSRRQPSDMPTLLESGTANGPGLAGLAAAIEFIQSVGLDVIRGREQALANRFIAGVQKIEGARLYGDFAGERVSVVSLNLLDFDAGAVSDALFTDYGIATRAGAHCAPLMHEALGTAHRGTVRFSFSYYNTEDEVDAALQALGELAASAERNNH